MSEVVKPSPDQKVVLTLADLQEVLNYVSTRPYAEVFKVVEALKKARTFEAVVKDNGYIQLPPPLQEVEAEEISVQSEA